MSMNEVEENVLVYLDLSMSGVFRRCRRVFLQRTWCARPLARHLFVGLGAASGYGAYALAMTRESRTVGSV
jgi:hypothetical protein